MTPLEIWGWAAALMGVVINIPQGLRLVRERTSAGVALLQWQVLIACAGAWTYHGFLAGHANIVASNIVAGLQAVFVVALLKRDRHLTLARLLPPIVGLLAVLLAVEVLGPPGSFGIAVVIPLALGMLAQARDLVAQPDISGISPVFLGMAVVLQFMWWSWSIPAGDVSITICASVLGLISMFNVGWLLLRRHRANALVTQE